MISGVYGIRRIGTDVWYVGSSVDILRRLGRHTEDLRAGKHHCIGLQRVWNKYPGEGFEHVVFEFVDDLETLRAREAHHIAIRRTYNSLVSDGAKLRHSEETRQKMTAGQLRYWDRRRAGGRITHSEETKRKIADSITGQKRSAASRAKMSESAKRRGMAHLHRPEVQEKSFATQRGKPRSERHREALRKAHAEHCRCPSHVAAREKGTDG
jgi:group I intron endonuclease